MRTKFTLRTNKLLVSAFFLAMLGGMKAAKAQEPFMCGLTYYVNGVGTDVTAPKDTFANLTGAYTAGAAYTSATGLISALNANGLDSNTLGQLTILLVSGYTGVEPNNNGVVINKIAYASPSRMIVMRPVSGVNFNITTAGALAANSAVLRFNGAQFFTVDGEGTIGQRNLTFTVNTTGASATQRVVDMISVGVPANNSPINTVSLMNVNLTGVATSSTVTTYAGVYIGGVNANTNSLFRNSGISVINCNIQGVQNGVYARGTGSVNQGGHDNGLIVRNNIIGGTSLIGGAANAAGIFLSNQANAIIEGNTISRNLASVAGFRGIDLSNVASARSLDSNIFINANRIHNISTTQTGSGVYGVRISLGNHQWPLGIKVTNNTIAKLTAPGNTTVLSFAYPIGVLIEDSTLNAGIDILNNSIALTGATLVGSTSACIATGVNTVKGIRVFNNILSNRMQNLVTNTTPYMIYSILVGRNPVTIAPAPPVVQVPFDSIDNNVYDVSTTGGWANIGYTQLNNYTTRTEWASFTKYDDNSMWARPWFANDSTLFTADGAGVNYGARGRQNMVATDILGNPRPASANPSIGAYQFVQDLNNSLGALMAGSVYPINGVENPPTYTNPGTGSFASFGSFVDHLNSFGTQGTGADISVVFSTGYQVDATVPPAIMPYPGMAGTRRVKVTTAPGLVADITIAAGQVICANSALVKLYGVSFFELNGAGPAMEKNINISLPTSANSPLAKLVALVPTIGSPVSSNFIQNCNLTGSSTTAVANTLVGIYMGAPAPAAGTASAVGGPNIFNFIGNNNIEAVRYGVFWRAKAGIVDQGLTVYKNTIGGTRAPGGALPTNYIGGSQANLAGIYLKGISQSTIDSNVVRNSITNNTGFRAIDLDGTSDEDGKPLGVNITRNTIYNHGSAAGYAVGVRISINATNRNIFVANNIIAKIYGPGSASLTTLGSPAGIAIESPLSNGGLPYQIGVSLINNTVHLSQQTTQVASGSFSTALFVNANAAGITARNNIFSNRLGRTSGAVSNAYVLTVSSNHQPFVDINTNVYYTGANMNFTNNQIGVAGAPNQLLSLFELRELYQQDLLSFFGEVPFLNDSTSAMDTMFVGHIAKRYIRQNSVPLDIAGKDRATGESSAGAVEIPKSYAALQGGATYQVNGILAPPTPGTLLAGSFNTINNLFRYINTNGVDANQPPILPINIEITSGYVGEGDTLISTLHDFPLMSLNRPIIIKAASGATPVIASTGATTASQYAAASSVIRFQGARWITIDGGPDRNITIRLPQSPANVNYVNNALTRVIDVVGWAQPATNITIKGCNILGYSTTNSITTFAGIYQGGVAFNNATPVPVNPIRTANNNNRYEGNFIGAVKYGIHLRGNNAVNNGQDQNLIVKSNWIGGDTLSTTSPTNYFGGINNAAGILVISQRNIEIDSNVIKNNLRGFTANSGIEISSPNLPAGEFNTNFDVRVHRNTITNLRSTLACAYGIYTNMRWDSQKSIDIYNNMISAISGTGTTPTGAGFLTNPYGILLDGSLPPAVPPAPAIPFLEIDVNVYNNSINLGQGTTLTTGISACVAVGSNTRGQITLVNNILQNRLSRAVAGGNIYAVVAAANLNPFSLTDYNNYHVAGTVSNNITAAVNVAVTPVNFTSVANWANYTKQDTLSFSYLTPFTNDSNLLIPNATASPLFRAGQSVSGLTRDILGVPRPGFSTGVSTIGAHEYIGSYLDIFPPKIYDYTIPNIFCFEFGQPILIESRIKDKSTTINDTLYYKINNGSEIALLASIKANESRVYEIPAQPRNTLIAYRFGGVDGASLPANFVNADPRSGYNYTSTMLYISQNHAINIGFDLPNIHNWFVEPVQGNSDWNLSSFGSSSNPGLAPLTGARAAMLPSSNGAVSRIVSPCLDFASQGSKRPTLRIFVSQNADNPSNEDNINVLLGYPGAWTPLAPPSGYQVNRYNPAFVVPGYKVYDYCLEGQASFEGIRLAIEGTSKGGGNIIIDSIVIFDNFISLPVTPKTQTNCFNDSINVMIANADSKFEYTLFDMLTGRYIGPTVKGTDANMLLQGYLSTSDSAYLRVVARNLTSGCTNEMDDTAIVYFRNFKNGPFVVKGSTFAGQYNAGDVFTPDAVKVGGEARYEIVPPAGNSNSNYGTGWTVSSVDMYEYFFDQEENEFIIVDSASDFVLVPPSPGNAGYVKVTGHPIDSNKTFILNVKLSILPQGCDSTISRYVTIANAPFANFYGPNDTLCANNSAIFTNLSTTGNFTLPLQYLWNFGDGTTSFASSPVKTFTTPGTYRVSMTVRNNTTLVDSLVANFVVLPSPIAEYTATLACSNELVKFTNNSSSAPGTTYKWNIGGQITTDKDPFAVVPGSDTIVNVILEVKNIEGCIDTAVTPIQVFAQPVASFATQNVCAGAPVIFNNTSTIDPGKNGRVNTIGSEWAFGNGDTGYSNSPSYFYPAGGTYNVLLKVISNYGCTDTATQTVSVFNKPDVDFTIDNACKGSNLIISNNTTFADGLSRLKYSWNFGDNNPFPITDAVPVQAYGRIGSFYVSLKATDSVNGCFDSVRTIVNVKETAIADFTASNGCTDQPVTFTNQSIIPSGAAATFTYHFGDNSTSNLPNTNHTYVIGGNKQIQFIVDVQGCRDTATKTIVISPPQSIAYIYTKLDSNTVKFTANKTGLAKYSWNFGDGTPVLNTKLSEVTHIFDRKGWNVVTLTSSDSNNCDAVMIDSVFIDRRVGIDNDPVAERINFNVYPNPFSTSTKVEFDLESNEQVTIEVFDMLGRNVFTHHAGVLSQGKQSVTLDENRFDAKSAAYMIRVHIGNEVINRQLLKH